MAPTTRSEKVERVEFVEEIDDYAVPPVWEHAINELLTFPKSTMTGKQVRRWVIYQQINDLIEFAMWDEATNLVPGAPTVQFDEPSAPNVLKTLKPN